MANTGIRIAGASDPGRVRTNNEDAFYVDAEGGIFLVVDGIGGQAAGEKAAAIAVERVRARLERRAGALEQRVREAIAMANNEILRAARDNPEWAGMGCVLTVAVLEDASAVVGHVGDSRLYQLRWGEIRKVTHDHSPVGEREDRGELSEGDAMQHPRRNEVFRDVGSEEHSPDDTDFIEVQRIPFDRENALVLCSDGLSDLVPSPVIRRTVERNAGNPEAAVRELIAAANSEGGKDNVTVIVVEGEAFQAPVSDAVAETGKAWLSGRAAFFALGLTLAAAGAWFSRPWWVPPPVVETPRVLVIGTGTPYPTIAAAMAAARPGDAIEVPSGEYNEQVRLANGVTLRSQSPRGAILRAAPVGGGPVVLAEDVKGGRISGFRILAAKDMPVSTGVLVDNSNVEIDDVEVDGAGIGMEIRGGARQVVRASSIHDCVHEGLLILGGAQPWILHNDFHGNKGAALAARDGARPVLLENVFENSSVELPADMLPSVGERNVILDAVGRRTAPRKKE